MQIILDGSAVIFDYFVKNEVIELIISLSSIAYEHFNHPHLSLQNTRPLSTSLVMTYASTSCEALLIVAVFAHVLTNPASPSLLNSGPNFPVCNE
jgi:hypothetical protein